MGAAIALASFVAVWWALVRLLKSKGKGAFARHIAGFAGGFFALLIVAAIATPEKKDSTLTAVKNTDNATTANTVTSVAAAEKVTISAKENDSKDTSA
jgi:hypothetical protein